MPQCHWLSYYSLKYCCGPVIHWSLSKSFACSVCYPGSGLYPIPDILALQVLISWTLWLLRIQLISLPCSLIPFSGCGFGVALITHYFYCASWWLQSKKLPEFTTTFLLRWSRTTSIMDSDVHSHEWTTLTNTTPHRPKHSSINILNERIKVEPLNLILSSELGSSTLEEQRLLEFLFPDTVLGFPIDEATAYLDKLGAFACPGSMIMPGNLGNLYFHDTLRCHVDNEAMMANHLNHIAKALHHRYPNLKCTWKWTSQNSSNPMPATHACKPDLALEGQVAELLSSWSIVHLIIEIKKHKCSFAHCKHYLQQSITDLRCSANMSLSDHSLDYLSCFWPHILQSLRWNLSIMAVRTPCKFRTPYCLFGIQLRKHTGVWPKGD